MIRLLTRSWYRLAIGLALLPGLAAATPTFAQSTDTESSASVDDPATPEPSDTVWFVLAPEGKSNGDYFDIELDAGDSTTIRATIGNGSDIPVTAIIYAADASSGVNGGFVLNGSELPTSDPTTWLDFPTTTYDFEPGELLESAFSVSVPEGTAPGQYMTGLAIETAEAEPMEGTAPFLVKYRLAAAVLITVPGPVSAEFNIGEITVTSDGATTTISGEIGNGGNIRVQPVGTLTVRDTAGAVLVDSPITMGSVYAGDTTTFEVVLPTPLPAGTYVASVELSDADTGASAAQSDREIEIVEQEAPVPVTISGASFTPMPSPDNVVFVQVALTMTNTATPLSGGEVTLRVYRDGEAIDDITLASSMTIQTGDTVIEQPYLPETGAWEAGTYTFEITLTANDPVTGTATTIATLTSETPVTIP